MSRRTAWLLLVALLCVALGWALGGRALSLPGLYYDEVIQARPALAFLEREPLPPAIPGMRATRCGGGWLPWMTQPYMGALKSQLLIPVFAVARPTPALLRGTTLAWALLGVALATLWVGRAYGLRTATVTGVLLAVDPSLLFIGRHDWGSFALGLLLRSAALLLLLEGWRRRRAGLLFAGGACLGLGVYNKVDFAVFAAAAGVALLAAWPGLLRQVGGTRRRDAAAAAGGLVVGLLPLLLALRGALAAAGAMQTAQGSGGDLAEKLAVTGAVLDGSYFQRLVLAGGRFDALFDVAGAAWSPMVIVLGLAAAGLALRLLRGRRTGDGDERAADARDGDGDERAADAFALLTLSLALVGLWLTPRAVRVHHTLNAWPFPQLVVALAAVRLWQAQPLRDHAFAVLARGSAVLGVASVLLGGLHVDLATLATLRETGGRGRWSDALGRYLETLPPQTRVASVDWGFDGPVRFLDPTRPARELVWALRAPRPAGLGLRVPGDADDVYLVHPDAYAVFPYGGMLLEAVAALPPDRVAVRTLRDHEGAPVFRAIRFAGPHVLVFRDGHVEVRLP